MSKKDNTNPISNGYNSFELDPYSIKLSNNPLDDYQRLYFATLLASYNTNGKDKDNNSKDNKLNLCVKNVRYKSSIAQIFNDPPFLHLKDGKNNLPLSSSSSSPNEATIIGNDNDNNNNNNISSDTTININTSSALTTTTTKKSSASASASASNNSNNILHCLEYQLPDVEFSNFSSSSSSSFESSNHSNIFNHLSHQTKINLNLNNNNNGNNNGNDYNNKSHIINGSIVQDYNDYISKISPRRKKSVTLSSTASKGNDNNNKEKLVITDTLNKNNKNNKNNEDDNNTILRKSIYDLNIKTGDISLSENQDLSSLANYSLYQNIDPNDNINNIQNFNFNNNNNSIMTNTNPNSNILTKNQQFKLTKIDHNLKSNAKLINKNNCILWNNDSGFVFLTGIWRLYQDIMKGLISMDRVSYNGDNNNNNNNNSINIAAIPDDLNLKYKERCQFEFEYILNFAFYEPVSSENIMNFNIITGGPENNDQQQQQPKRRKSLDQQGQQQQPIKQHRRRRNSSISHLHSTTENIHAVTSPAEPSLNLSSESQNLKENEDPNSVQSNINNYTDLHWNNLSNDLKQLIVDDFKKSLLKKYKNLDETDFTDLDLTMLVQRIRGGYIKIQGTWLPMEIARLICCRFCFPIRYLLVPIFGPNFPKECENWYKIIESNIETMIEKNKKLVNLQLENRNKKQRQRTKSRQNSNLMTTSPTKRKRKNSSNNTTNNNNTIQQNDEISPRSKKTALNKINDGDSIKPTLNQNIFSKSGDNQKLKEENDKENHENCPIPNPIPSINQPTTGYQYIRSNSDFGVITTRPRRHSADVLPPITSLIEQVNRENPYFINNDNNYNNDNTSTDSTFYTPTVGIRRARPRNNSLPTTYPNITNVNPTVSTLSSLATFYNTNGHRYSYPNIQIHPNSPSNINHFVTNFQEDLNQDYLIASQTNSYGSSTTPRDLNADSSSLLLQQQNISHQSVPSSQQERGQQRPQQTQQFIHSE